MRTRATLALVLQGPRHTHRSIPHSRHNSSFPSRLLELIRHVGDVHDEPVRA